MKRLLLALPLLLLAVPAHAQDTFITNNSRLAIDDIYPATPGTRNWGNDLTDDIPEGKVDPGKAHQVRPLADGVYDFRVSTPEFRELCIIKNVPVTNGQIVLTDDQFTLCK